MKPFNIYVTKIVLTFVSTEYHFICVAPKRFCYVFVCVCVSFSQLICGCPPRSRRPAEADRRHPAAGAGGVQRNLRSAHLPSGWHGGYTKPVHTATGWLMLTCTDLYMLWTFLLF